MKESGEGVWGRGRSGGGGGGGGGEGGEMIQEASKATAEQGSERCIRPMFIS